VEQAELGLECWRATRTGPDRDTAVKLLRRAFDVEPSAVVRHWFAELAEPLPDLPPPLPPPIGIGRARTTGVQLEAAFARLETALGAKRIPPSRRSTAGDTRDQSEPTA